MGFNCYKTACYYAYRYIYLLYPAVEHWAKGTRPVKKGSKFSGLQIGQKKNMDSPDLYFYFGFPPYIRVLID